MNKISVVVPCFNEEEVLSMFYKKTSEVLNEIEDITYELLFVDDGSKDHTKDILRALSLKDDRCEFVSFSRNFGKEAAMFAGLKKIEWRLCCDHGCRFAASSCIIKRNV